MNSKERLLTTLNHQEPDHTPLLAWCFGFTAPPHLRWQRDGQEIVHWYTGRLEHIHTLPQPWRLPEDDFRRVDAWLSLGLDDVLEVSVPWSIHPSVRVRDWREPPPPGEAYPLLCRAYETPAGELRHIVRRTGEDPGPGWVVQPAHVPLFEDFNIPRALRHAVRGPEDLPKLRYLFQGPTAEQIEAYRQRMTQVRAFADARGVLVQGWSAFGIDGVIWLTGVERAVLAAMTEPDFFQELIDILYDFDRRRTEILLDVGGVDIVAQRGWYSSTEFWSPTLFRRFVLPHLQEMVALVHQAGIRYAYVMTTGVLPLADLLLESGIDLLYYVDPVQDNADLAAVKAKFRGKLAVAGGINSGVTLARGAPQEIAAAVRAAMRTLGPGGGFILAPVDALFPDTPWSSVEAMIAAWREACKEIAKAGR